MTRYRLSAKSVNILGTEYKIELKTEEEDKSLEKYSGYCDKFLKKIVIRSLTEEEVAEGIDYTENIVGMLNDTLIHELTHAFMYESGINWTDLQEEDLCYWMSSNLQKIYSVYKIAEIYE